MTKGVEFSKHGKYPTMTQNWLLELPTKCTVAVIKIYTTAWGIWPLQNCIAAEYRLSGFCGSGILLP